MVFWWCVGAAADSAALRGVGQTVIGNNFGICLKTHVKTFLKRVPDGLGLHIMTIQRVHRKDGRH